MSVVLTNLVIGIVQGRAKTLIDRLSLMTAQIILCHH